MHPTRHETVSLANAEPFAVGGRRWCFEHPVNPAWCIKINRTDEGRFGRLEKRRLAPVAVRRGLDDNRHDRRELTALERRLGRRFAHLPRYHGEVETDKGTGFVFDLVRDDDGRIARTVRALLCEGIPLDDLRPAFNELADFLVRNRVLTRALLDHNIVAQRLSEGGWSLTLIDGFGDPAFVPVASWIPSVGRAKMRRRVADAWERFERLASGDERERTFDTSRWSQGFLNHRGAAATARD